jgi:hypothetical protein
MHVKCFRLSAYAQTLLVSSVENLKNESSLARKFFDDLKKHFLRKITVSYSNIAYLFKNWITTLFLRKAPVLLPKMGENRRKL